MAMSRPGELIGVLQRFALTGSMYNDIVNPRMKRSVVDEGGKGTRLTTEPRRERDDGKKEQERKKEQWNTKEERKKEQRIMKEERAKEENTIQERVKEEKAKDGMYKAHTRDQLFWCLLMVARSWEEADIPDKRERFLIETTEKTTMTEILQKTTDVPWKELKLSRTAVCSALGASINGKMSVDVMRALAFVYGKNIAYVWGKGRCVKIPGARASGTAHNAQKWHVIMRSRAGYALAKDETATGIMRQIDEGEFYVVDDPNKPLMAASAYKLGELQEIADRIGVSITRDGGGGKAKLKKDLYQDIVCAIHKID